jgi:hypothetical protein
MDGWMDGWMDGKPIWWMDEQIGMSKLPGAETILRNRLKECQYISTNSYCEAIYFH